MMNLIKSCARMIRNSEIVWEIRETMKEDYHGYKKAYIHAKNNGLKIDECWNFIRWIYVLIRYGASAKEYFLYEFYKKNMYEINTYVTRRRRYWFMKQLNEGTYRKPVEDKVLFSKMFAEFTKRKIIDGNAIESQEFFKLINSDGEGKRWIVKPREGYDGKDIFVFTATKDKGEMQKIYKKIYGKGYVIEEYVKQIGKLHDLNPQTVNTIRVNVLNWQDTLFVVNAFLRIGQGGEQCVDNFHAGGVVAAIDLQSGIVTYGATDLDMHYYVFHPITKLQILGTCIPRWDEVLDIVKKAALKVADVPYTSWDVMVSEDRVLIIEGNTYGDTELQQVSDKIGKWKIYKDFTRKVIMDRKRLKKSHE